MARQHNPFGTLNDGRIVFYTREYEPHEVKRDEAGNITKAKNAGELLTELSGHPIKWMPAIGAFVRFDQLESLSKTLAKEIAEYMATSEYLALFGSEATEAIYKKFGKKIRDEIKKVKESLEKQKQWADLSKETKQEKVKAKLRSAYVGGSTTEAIDSLNFYITLRNRTALDGRLGAFLREHPEVLEAVAAGKRLDRSVVEDIEQHAYKLGYAGVQATRGAGKNARPKITFSQPRLEELHRDISYVAPYIRPQVESRTYQERYAPIEPEPRQNNPYISFLAPRSAGDGGANHRERGYYDAGKNTYTPFAGSRYFEEGRTYDFAEDKDQSKNLFRAASLLAYAQANMSESAKRQADRTFFACAATGKMDNATFASFVAFLSEHSDGLIGTEHEFTTIKKLPKYSDQPAAYTYIERAKAAVKKAAKATQEAKEKVEEVEEIREEIQVIEEKVEQAEAKVKKARKKKEKAVTTTEKNAVQKEIAKATAEAKEAVQDLKEAVQDLKEASVEAQEANERAQEANKEAEEATSLALAVVEQSGGAESAEVVDIAKVKRGRGRKPKAEQVIVEAAPAALPYVAPQAEIHASTSEIFTQGAKIAGDTMKQGIASKIPPKPKKEPAPLARGEGQGGIDKAKLMKGFDEAVDLIF